MSNISQIIPDVIKVTAKSGELSFMKPPLFYTRLLITQADGNVVQIDLVSNELVEIENEK